MLGKYDVYLIMYFSEKCIMSSNNKNYFVGVIQYGRF